MPMTVFWLVLLSVHNLARVLADTDVVYGGVF